MADEYFASRFSMTGASIASEDGMDFPKLAVGHRHLRLAMHGTLLAIGLMSLFAVCTAWQSERKRYSDAELINLAGAQRMLSQRLALLAARPRMDGGAAMNLTVERAKRESQRIQVLLGMQDPRQVDNLPGALIAATDEWQASSQLLWKSAQEAVKALPDDASEATTREAERSLHAQADAALESAQNLVTQIQRRTDAESTSAMQALATTAGAGALMMLLLGFLAVEPAIGRLRRQEEHLTRRLAQHERLSLVAEHTHNIVIITDVERRIVWANQAFVRITGYSLAEALGKNPAELLQTDATDKDALAALREALDAGRGMRVELLNRSREGRDYWLDMDIQPLHDDHGKLTGFIAVETDITDLVFQRVRLRTLLDTLPTGVVEQDASTQAIVQANQAAEQVLGLSRDQLLGRLSYDERWRTVREDLRPYPGDQHPISRSMRDGVSVRDDYMGVVTPSGEQRWLLVNSKPLRNPNGVITGAVTCFVDVTEQRDQRKLLQLALQAADIGTWEWRVDSGERKWNEASCRMLGYSMEEFAPLLPSWRDMMHPEDRQKIEGLIKRHLDDPSVPYRGDMRVRHRAGHWIWIEAFGAVVDRDVSLQARRMVGVHMDITGRKRQEVALQASAFTDALTGLPNRAAVMVRIQAMIAEHQRDRTRHFAVLFLDVDRFKQVNDTLGHAAGDELLRGIAQRLRGTLRSRDALLQGEMGIVRTAARMGGDEFVVLLDGLRKASDACAVAERMVQVLGRPYELRGRRVHSSASIGLVSSDHAFDSAESLLRDADTAMYEAKETGRGRWVSFETRMHEKVSRRAVMESDLHEAIERNELFVVYQPVLTLQAPTDRPGCAGVEALVRWRHPKHGVIPPVQFITVAEECGLIDALGQFVLRTACQQFMRWRLDLGEMAPALLAVNMSVAQLRQPDLVALVNRILSDSGMPAAALQLEVTESIAAQDPMVQARLRELKSLGVRVALDDFGTGYSSLSCLHLLPVDTVKIDRSFVIEAERSEYHRALIEATIRVARTLRMTTVAEGIETLEQAALVASLGCDRGQGYLYSKPLEPEALASWLGVRELRREADLAALSNDEWHPQRV